jgi:hypothetical protein
MNRSEFIQAVSFYLVAKRQQAGTSCGSPNKALDVLIRAQKLYLKPINAFCKSPEVFQQEIAKWCDWMMNPSQSKPEWV